MSRYLRLHRRPSTLGVILVLRVVKVVTGVGGVGRAEGCEGGVDWEPVGRVERYEGRRKWGPLVRNGYSRQKTVITPEKVLQYLYLAVSYIGKKKESELFYGNSL